jgi:hypothetical protein
MHLAPHDPPRNESLSARARTRELRNSTSGPLATLSTNNKQEIIRYRQGTRREFARARAHAILIWPDHLPDETRVPTKISPPRRCADYAPANFRDDFPLAESERFRF